MLSRRILGSWLLLALVAPALHAMRPGAFGLSSPASWPGCCAVMPFDAVPGFSIYGLAQFPIYERVNGIQVVAESNLVLGVSRSLYGPVE